MNTTHRQGFRGWFSEVGYLYLLVILLITVIFFVKDLGHQVTSVQSLDPVSRNQVLYNQDE